MGQVCISIILAAGGILFSLSSLIYHYHSSFDGGLSAGGKFRCGIAFDGGSNFACTFTFSPSRLTSCWRCHWVSWWHPSMLPLAFSVISLADERVIPFLSIVISFLFSSVRRMRFPSSLSSTVMFFGGGHRDYFLFLIELNAHLLAGTIAFVLFFASYSWAAGVSHRRASARITVSGSWFMKPTSTSSPGSGQEEGTHTTGGDIAAIRAHSSLLIPFSRRQFHLECVVSFSGSPSSFFSLLPSANLGNPGRKPAAGGRHHVRFIGSVQKAEMPAPASVVHSLSRMVCVTEPTNRLPPNRLPSPFQFNRHNRGFTFGRSP